VSRSTALTGRGSRRARAACSVGSTCCGSRTSARGGSAAGFDRACALYVPEHHGERQAEPGPGCGCHCLEKFYSGDRPLEPSARPATRRPTNCSPTLRQSRGRSHGPGLGLATDSRGAVLSILGATLARGRRLDTRRPPARPLHRPHGSHHAGALWTATIDSAANAAAAKPTATPRPTPREKLCGKRSGVELLACPPESPQPRGEGGYDRPSGQPCTGSGWLPISAHHNLPRSACLYAQPGRVSSSPGASDRWPGASMRQCPASTATASPRTSWVGSWPRWDPPRRRPTDDNTRPTGANRATTRRRRPALRAVTMRESPERRFGLGLRG
jgi:hypothetical protein